jgi:hypothetical protein
MMGLMGLLLLQLHTRSQERFQPIMDEAAPEHQALLVWSPILTDGSNCKVRTCVRLGFWIQTGQPQGS